VNARQIAPPELDGQLALEEYQRSLAAAAKSEGQARALHAVDSDGDWARRAALALDELIEGGGWFDADDLVAMVGPAPSPGSCGAVFGEAAKAGRIASSGVRSSKRQGRHGSLLRVWHGVYEP
jgi:hypothetical protein